MSSNTPADLSSRASGSGSDPHSDISSSCVTVAGNDGTIGQRMAVYETAMLVLARAIGESEARRRINRLKRRGAICVLGRCVMAALIFEGLLAATVTYYWWVTSRMR